MTTCPKCDRPCICLLTVSGRGGHTQMCSRCYLPPVEVAAPARSRKR